MKSDHVFDSVVVGAGVSGLTAGCALADAGKDIVALEANDYAGGRVKTERYGSLYAEAGGMIVTDEDTAALQMLRDFSIPLTPPWGHHGSEMFIADEFVTLNGRGDDSKNLDTIVAIARKLANEPRGEVKLPVFSESRFVEAYNEVLRLIKNESKLIDFPYVPDLREKWDTLTFAEFLDSFDPHLRAYFDLQLKAIAAESVDLISFFWGVITTQWNADNNFYAIEGGTDRLPRALTAKLDERVLLNVPVKTVTSSNNGLVRVCYLKDRELKEIRARTVIMATLPKTVRKLVSGLDNEKRDSLSRVTFGSYIPVHLRFRERFWEESIKTGYLNCAGLVFADIVDATRDQNEKGGILICFIAGSDARVLINVSDSVILKLVLRDFEKVFPGKASQVIEARIFQWPDAIPYLTIGYASIFADIQRPHGNIYFCGDYTLGAGLNEAIYSGQVAALEVIDRLQ